MNASLLLALRQITRSPLRTILVLLAVASGVATLIAAEMISLSVTAEINHTLESEAITGFMGEQMGVSLTATGLVVSAGAGFLLLNSISMSVAQRRGDLGRLRAAGMTRSQLVGMILAEAAILGLFGSMLGFVMGIGVGRGIIYLVESTSDIFNQFGQAGASVERVIMAVVLGVVISIGAAVAPARKVARLAPVDALRPDPPGGERPARLRWTAAGLIGSIALWLVLALSLPGKWVPARWVNHLVVLSGLIWLLCITAVLPGLITVVGRLASQKRGHSGINWMAGDNFRRSHHRIALSTLTLTVAVAMIVTVTGFLTYWFDELFFRNASQKLTDRPAFGFFPIDVEQGLAGYQGITTFSMPPDFRRDVAERVGSQGTIIEAYFVLAPELSFLGESYFSYVLPVDDLRASGDLLFSFSYGDWDSALKLAAKGCVLFVTPGVAQRNDAWLEEAITIQTPTGTIACTIAGIGPTYVGASIISASALPNYQLQAPVSVMVFPNSPVDRLAMLPEMRKLADATPGVWYIDIARMAEVQQQGMKSVGLAMDGLLLLAVMSAALGVVNTTFIGLLERRRELGILRAIGATRGQLLRIVALEGFYSGFLGSALGAILGIGLVILYVLISAGNPLGYPDFPIWTAALNSAQAALAPALFAILTTPLLTALSALIPAHRMVTNSAISMLGLAAGQE